MRLARFEKKISFLVKIGEFVFLEELHVKLGKPSHILNV